MNFEPGQKAEKFREPGLVSAFHAIGTLSLIGGLLLSLALFDKEYALGLLGISAIINAVIMFGFAAVISNLAEINWHSKKATKQREFLVSQAREIAKALQWIVNNWKQEGSKPPHQQQPPV